MWVYHQATGQLTAPDGHDVARGYSGHGIGRNNPALQQTRNVGPIPCGLWHIAALECEHVAGPHGPYVLRLLPAAGTNTFGRDGFLCHGDSAEHPGMASEGCIILPRSIRELLWASADRFISVVAR